MSLRPGEVFAGYTVERELGAGGMGSVYLARHPRLPRFDALKLLRSELCADPGFVGRFEREADTVAQLDHPNIVPVYDRGSQDGQLWISMRFIDGSNAEKALEAYDQGMPPERAVRIVGRVASALDYAHKHQLLHRDVKPANILLTPGPDDDDEAERVFLSDFGVAKAIGEAAERISSLTSTGSVVATLDYASPEQIKGQVLDHRTDIYALGCVLYKLLTGTVPFPGESVAARVYGHLNSAPPAPSALVPGLPTAFDSIIATAMAKEAADRYPSCRALASAARVALTAAAAEPAPLIVAVDDAGLTTTVNRIEQPIAERPSPTGPVQPSYSGPGQSSPDTGRHHLPPDPASFSPGAASFSPGAASFSPGAASFPLDPETFPPDAVIFPPGLPNVPSASSAGGPGSRAVAGSAAGVGSAGGPLPAAGVARPASPAGSDASVAQPGPARSRRTAIIGASVAAIVVIGAVTAALILGGNVAGIGVAGSTTESPTQTSTSQSTVASSSAAESTGVPGPVPGLPHSTPLPEEVLVGSRNDQGSSNLYQFDATTGALGQRLTTDSPGTQFAILSPDRGSIIYVQPGGSGATLRTMAVDGSGDRDLGAPLPPECTSITRPAWNPVDQTTLALACGTTDGTKLYRVSLTGAEPQPIDINAPVFDDVAYSPDGTTLAFWAAEGGNKPAIINTIPADGSGAAEQLVEPVPGSSDADPIFSPDGSKIAFSRADGAGHARIVVADADGSNPVPLTDGTASDQDPTFSPDGNQLAFKSDRPNAAGTAGNQLWVINADGNGLKELGVGSPGVGDGAPAWGHR